MFIVYRFDINFIKKVDVTEDSRKPTISFQNDFSFCKVFITRFIVEI